MLQEETRMRMVVRKGNNGNGAMPYGVAPLVAEYAAGQQGAAVPRGQAAMPVNVFGGGAAGGDGRAAETGPHWASLGLTKPGGDGEAGGSKPHWASLGLTKPGVLGLGMVRDDG